MRKVLSFFIIFCAFFASTAFAASKKAKAESKAAEKKVPPAWVFDKDSVYSPAEYISAVGTGASRKEAESAAVSEIASQFSQNVGTTVKSSKRMEQLQKDGKVSVANVQGLSQDITRNVDANNLIAVELKGAYDDGNEFYAIAVIEKAKGAAIYTQMIQKNNEEIDFLLDFDEDEKFSFEGFARVDAAHEIATLNEEHLMCLQYINYGAAQTIRQETKSPKELAPLRNEIAKGIPIGVFVKNDATGRIASALKKCFASHGFRCDGNEESRFAVEIDFQFDDARITSNGKNVQGFYSVDGGLFDKNDGEMLVPVSFNKRITARDATIVVQQTWKDVEKQIGEKFSQALSDYLGALIK